jgi:hypothetical protein
VSRSLPARVGLISVAVLSVAVALASVRYALPEPPAVPPEVAANLFYRPWLAVHALLALVALTVGPFQFIGRGPMVRARWHRISGKVYIAACLLSAPIGLTLAIGTSAGPVAAVGFGLLAIAWFSTTALGLKAALERRFADHRRWMIRSFALTFAAVTLRLYLPIGPMLGFSFEEAYVVISWMAWVPNLMVAELILRATARKAVQPA